MINRKASAFLMGMFLVCYAGTAVMADDTEIYDGTGSPLSPPPLVMFQIDLQPAVLNATFNCTSSMCATLISDGYLASSSSTNFGVVIAVLKYVLNSLGNVKIGLMVSHGEQRGRACYGRLSSDCSGGGYIMMGLEEITTDAWDVDPVKSEFFKKLSALQEWSEGTYTSTDDSAGNAKIHLFQGKEVFFEFFRYLTGHRAFSSHLGWADYGTSSTNNLNHSDDYDTFMRDLDIEGISLSGSAAMQATQYGAPGTYTSPLTEDCQKVFTVNFLKGGLPQVQDDADTEILNGSDPSDATARSGSGDGSKLHGAMEDIALSGSNPLETVLEYLNGADFADGSWGVDVSHAAPDLLGTQNVTSYFVVSHSGLTTGHSWAQAGGTPSAIEWDDGNSNFVKEIQSVFYQILSTSTTFTAASVPVSVLNRAQIVDNVYIALFKSDPDGYETWPGNVKRLRLDTDVGTLVDAEGSSAINPNDGRINNTALTFWTDESSLPTADPDNDEVDGKDGRSVKRGGAGQITPGFRSSDTMSIGSTNTSGSTRMIYYEPSSGTAMGNLNVDDTTGTALMSDLGAADVEEAKYYLRYIRGFDVSTDKENETTARSWIMGDPLHSRPLPINYGNSSNPARPDIRLVFGSNDGLFRMVQNTIDNPTMDVDDYGVEALGRENWAFMPRAVMGMIPKLVTNDGSNTHPYGVDGAPTAYLVDINNDGVIDYNTTGDKAWVFFGLRRGGRGVYALDVTNPDAPTFMWSKDSSDYSELGYTFSQPRIGYLNWGSGKRPVIIFAGGYDLDKDDQLPHDGSDDDMGNAFFILDAEDGSLVWKVTKGGSGSTGSSVSATQYAHPYMQDSIPSTVSSVDTNGDGLTDRAYVGDTGGRVWRFDMIGTDRTAWKASVLADVGYRNDTNSGNDRRFFHRPDFIQYQTEDGNETPYDAVIIASGNRAHPMKDMDNDDFLYVIKDWNITGVSTQATITHSQMFDVTTNCLQDSSCVDDPADISAALVKGWKLEFEENGEKSLATPTTLARKIFVTTYLPEGGAVSADCTPPEGAGRLYALDLTYGTAVNDYDVTNGDAMEKSDRYTDLASGGIPAEVVYVPFNRILKPDLSIENVGVSGRWKTYWYKKED